MKIRCLSCHEAYPESEIPYLCPGCGGLYDVQGVLPYRPDAVEPSLPGIWRYRHCLGLPPESPTLSLGEGQTPLLWREVFGRQVGFKLENLNPTGSFKDRGTAVLVSFLRGRGAASAVEDSSGNAGASFAAYAARSGMRARVYVPAYASGSKREQIAGYGAEVIPVPGPRSQAAAAVQEAASAGQVYASHAHLPFGISGFSTIAFELLEDMERGPGSVVMPVGHGSLLLGLHRGFKALQRRGALERLPALIGVQARACAPLWQAFQKGSLEPVQVRERETLAEGVRIKEPYRGNAVLQAIQESGGRFVAVDEPDIKAGRQRLAALGYYVEPTSALVWDGLAQTAGSLTEPIVVILTGHGLKSP